MESLTLEDFQGIIGAQFTIDNPNDDLPPHVLTLVSCEELLQTEDERRNPFALYFSGAPLLDSLGVQAMQGTFIFHGGILDGKEIFITVNGFINDSVESYEYEAVFS